MDPLLIASGVKFGYDLLQRGEQRDFAKGQLEGVGEQIRMLNQQKKEIEKLYDQRRTLTKEQFQDKLKLLTTRYKYGTSVLTSKSSKAIGDIGESAMAAMGKSGLSHLGSIERAKEVGFRDILQEREQGKEIAGIEYKGQYTDVENLLGEKMLSILESETTQLGDIDLTIKQLEGQKKSLEQQADDKFLGIF